MIRKTLLIGAVAALGMVGSAAYAKTIDLGFIMDRSGSVGSDFPAAMDALGDALAAHIPVGGADTYRISVVSFASGASVVVGATTINTAGDLAGVVTTIKAQNANGSGATNYQAALDLLGAQFGTLGDLSMINMMTDGEPNIPTNAVSAARTSATNLQNAGWDSLSFESVGNASGDALLAGLGFGPGNTPNDANLLPIISDVNLIGNPATDPFVLTLADFPAYNAAIGKKVQQIVNPDPVPVPASLPLLVGGLGMIAFIRRRRKAA